MKSALFVFPLEEDTISPLSLKRIQFLPWLGSFFKLRISHTSFSLIFCLLGSLQNLEATIISLRIDCLTCSSVMIPLKASQ